MIEQGAARFERMSHRRAIHLDEDVAGQIVLLIPALKTRQQRPVACGQAHGCVRFRNLRDRRQQIGPRNPAQQVIGKHGSAPDEPRFGSERQRRQPAFTPCVCRKPSRAEAGKRAHAPRGGRRGSTERLRVRQVPGKQLVATVAGQTNRYVRARQLGDKKRRNRRRIGERLVVVDRQAVRHADAVRRHHPFVVVRAERPRGHSRGGQLVVLRIAKPDRKRLHRTRRVPGHEREYRRRIEAAAQERAQRHVRTQTDPNRLVELRAEPFQVLVVGNANVAVARPRPVTFDARRPTAIERQHGAGREAEHPVENRAVAGHVAEREELEQRRLGDIGNPRQRGKDRLRLGCEQEAIARLHVVQGLLANTIPRQHQPPARRIPNGDREHAAHPLERRLAMLGVERGNHFGVACGGKRTPAPLELGSKLDVVVDLAVLHDGYAAPVDRDGLMAAGDVDDAQPGRGQGRGSVRPHAGVVGAAIPHRLDHRRQRRDIRGRAARGHESGDATHIRTTLARDARTGTAA